MGTFSRWNPFRNGHHERPSAGRNGCVRTDLRGSLTCRSGGWNTGRLVTRAVQDGPTVFTGALYFRTHSNTKNVAIDYRDQIDSFGVYSPDLDLVLLVPVDAVPIRGCLIYESSLPRNGQRIGVRRAADYLIGPP